MYNRLMVFCFVLTLFSSTTLWGATIRVPEDQPTIQLGINSAAEGDIVSVADGTFTGSGNVDIVLQGKTIAVVSRNGPEKCIIDCKGDQNNPHRGFYIFQSETQATVIQGFTIQNGYMAGVTTDDCGGAIRCAGASPTIKDCVIKNNTAVYGGGVHISDDSEARMIECSIEGNTALKNCGGVDVYSSNAEILSCRIHQNTAAEFGGGLATSVSDSLIYDCTVDHNTASTAGGIFLDSGHPKVANCIISANIATGSGGAGLYLRSNSSAMIVNCIISDNIADGAGGAVLCLFSYGMIDSCLMTNNNSNSWGGAIQFQDSTITVGNCTLASNSSSYGSAIMYNFDHRSKLINCIIWNPLDEMEVYVTGSDADISYSDIRGGWEGEGNIDADPLFVAGPSGDYYLSHIAAGNTSDSPCINAGQEPAASTCFSTGLDPYCMNKTTTRIDEVKDQDVVDMGYHYQLPSMNPGLNLYLDDPQLEAGDTFYLHYDLYNSGYDLMTTDVWILLDVFGAYWCYPTWVSLNENVAWKTLDVKFMRTYHESVFEFPWPEVNGSVSGLRFWGVAFKSGTQVIFGDLQLIEWAYL